MSARPVPAAGAMALPRLTRNEAEARTLLAQNVQHMRVAIGDDTWELSVEPLARDAALGFGGDDCAIRGEWAGAAFELRAPASAVDLWVRGKFPADDWPALPPPLRAAAFEAALRELLQALEATGRGTVRIDGIDEPAGQPGNPAQGHHFGLSLARDGAAVPATLSTDSFGLMLLAGLAAQQHSAPGPLARAGVPVVLRAEIGKATVTHAALRGLAAGDAVLLDEYFPGDDDELWLRHQGWGLKVHVEGTHLEVTEPFGSMEDMMDDDYDDPDDDDGFGDEEPAGLDEMPVRLHFDIGQRTMPLGELCQLQVGQVLELSRPLSQAVNIRANGTLVGTGELVEIGGRIAVSITSLGRKGAAPATVTPATAAAAADDEGAYE